MKKERKKNGKSTGRRKRKAGEKKYCIKLVRNDRTHTSIYEKVLLVKEALESFIGSSYRQVRFGWSPFGTKTKTKTR